jgi:sulfite reductase (NADPH) flavoprotein alpha-component
MIISIWRYSHFALAVSSFVFIALAAITGIILAVEPISDRIRPYRAENFETLNTAQLMGAINGKYDEVLGLEIDPNGYVAIDAINFDGDLVQGYIDPNDGSYLGPPIEKTRFFQFVTNLHRSLFLKSIGRAFIGLTSFFLFLIALTGAVLIIRRQKGIWHFFTRIIKEDFAQYGHIMLGRLSLIPIFIISLSGVYLSLLTFDILPNPNTAHKLDYAALTNTARIPITEFDSFKTLPIQEVRQIEFPFSPEVEDLFTIRLKGGELLINQFTGKIESALSYPLVAIFSDISLRWHTGRGSVIWSIILGIACINILFFIWSGFKITLKRKSARLKNKFTQDTAEIIVLVGSENGSTTHFAKAFHEQLLQNGKASYISYLNRYSQYPKAKNLVVITATYGQGEPPTNAKKFLARFSQIEQNQNLSFAVIGFGSLAYPHFCRFAADVNKKLSSAKKFNQDIPLTTINDKSIEAFETWVAQWSKSTGIPIILSQDNLKIKLPKTQAFQVIAKTDASENPDHTFLLQLKPKGIPRFESGDLLAIYPANDHHERLYSVAKTNGSIRLSIKLHEFGLGSQFLHNLETGALLKARLIQNKAFHFPKNSPRVLLIANGTGMAPFLGMIPSHGNTSDIHLFWGGRTQGSWILYQNSIESFQKSGLLKSVHLAYSRIGDKIYVQDKIVIEKELVVQTLKTMGHIMICGSLAMQKEVLDTMAQICLSSGLPRPDVLIKEGRIKTDCY